MISQQLLKEVLSHFQILGKCESIKPYGNGHINDTFILQYRINHKTTTKIILQRMNTNVFKRPIELMENILNVTAFLKKRIIENGGDAQRETLTVLLTSEGLPYYCDHQGHYWRGYYYISDTTSYDFVTDDEDFYQSALAFGRFQSLLATYPAHTLHETIPDFHNTAVRLEAFKKAVAEDICQRAQNVQAEIRFVFEHENLAYILNDMQRRGELSIRVTHNDTKLNNVLIDNKTHQAICVIDLDTVMPGLAVNDFGDAIRFGASTGAEDEKDLSLIACDMHLFDVFVKGFLEGCENRLTENEIKALPIGAIVMTFECGLRFLTDYLQGDLYFKTHYPNHNLDRCRTQFCLVSDMEKKWEVMNNIVLKYQHKS